MTNYVFFMAEHVLDSMKIAHQLLFVSFQHHALECNWQLPIQKQTDRQLQTAKQADRQTENWIVDEERNQPSKQAGREGKPDA
jgi:hypothetical protein